MNACRLFCLYVFDRVLDISWQLNGLGGSYVNLRGSISCRSTIFFIFQNHNFRKSGMPDALVSVCLPDYQVSNAGAGVY